MASCKQQKPAICFDSIPKIQLKKFEVQNNYKNEKQEATDKNVYTIYICIGIIQNSFRHAKLCEKLFRYITKCMKRYCFYSIGLTAI